MSNRERIARAAAEAQAAAVEREQKKALKSSQAALTARSDAGKAGSAKPGTSKSVPSKAAAKPGEPAKPRPKRVPKPTRMKIVWEICSGSGEVVKTFPYSEKAAAEAELVRLSNTKREHVLRNTKVPMVD
jgi:hypothetical protein